MRPEAWLTVGTVEIHRRLPQTVGMKLLSLGIALAAGLAFAGCDRSVVSQQPGARPVAASAPVNAIRTNAPPTGSPQLKLPAVKLLLGTQEITAEQALSKTQIEIGMMFRKEMGEQEGMLFVFPGPYRASFWMRNTLLPLTCAYVDPEGVILEIRDMKPLDESPIQAASDRVQYVLEMNQGWFGRHNITTNMVIRTERGSLRETYFPQ